MYNRCLILICILVCLAFISLSCENDSPTGSSVQGTYSVSGTIVGQDSTGVDGVLIQLSGAGGSISVETDSTGAYEFTGITNGSYLLTPLKAGYKFNPHQILIVMTGTDESVGDITSVLVLPPDIIFASIPAGTFLMGDQTGLGYPNELPVHSVTVTSFEMSKYEVTNAQYAVFLNDALATEDIAADSSSVTGAAGEWNGRLYIDLAGHYKLVEDCECKIVYSDGIFSVKPSYENWPVVYVTWYGAKAYANYFGLDLPTEEEWEYACRAGSQKEYGTRSGEMNRQEAHYSGSIDHPIDVGSYAENSFGLCDMSGNAHEWCNDWFIHYPNENSINLIGDLIGSERVFRGGGWHTAKNHCRSARRFGYGPGTADEEIGFRIVRRTGGMTE